MTVLPTFTKFCRNCRGAWVHSNYGNNARSMSRSAEVYARAIPIQETANSRITFEELRLHPPIIASLKSAFPHIQYPTYAQAKFIPEILGGKDVMLSDVTGSGKSFGLMLALLTKPRLVSRAFSDKMNRHITSLVIVPHRDLSYQLLHWIEHMINVGNPSSSTASIAQVLVRGSGAHLTTGLMSLKMEPPHILIGTPQALMDVHQLDPAALQFSTLSSVLVDEVDYLIETAPRKDSEKSYRRAAEKAKLKLLAHPSVTKQLLDIIYARRMEQRRGEPGSEVNRSHAGWSDGSTSTIISPQLILSSATLRTHLKNYIFNESGWLDKDNVVKISGIRGTMNEFPLNVSTGAMGDDNARAQHSILLVSKNHVRNVPSAVEASPLLSSAAGSVESVSDLAEGNDIESNLKSKYSNTPSPFKPEILETIAIAFALDVPSIALLVLPNAAPLHRAVHDLRELGVNAHGLDLQTDQSHLLGGGSGVGGNNPTLLVSNLATTRGVDLPELSHVFMVGLTEGQRVNGRMVDAYVHISGRVGRFGRNGKVITIVEDPSECGELKKEEKGGAEEEGRKSAGEASKVVRILKTIELSPVRFEHFD